MKKKIVIMLAAVFILCGQVSAKEKDPNGLLTGIILMSMGGIVAYSGFRMVDISSPILSTQSFTWNDGDPSPWDATASGVIKNTGNVPLTNIILTVEYKDSMGAIIGSDTVADNKSSLAVGETSTFSSSYDCNLVQPRFISVRSWHRSATLYENSDLLTGFVGAGVIAAGVFFICDYFFDITDFFEGQEAKVQLSSSFDGVNLTVSKIF